MNIRTIGIMEITVLTEKPEKVDQTIEEPATQQVNNSEPESSATSKC